MTPQRRTPENLFFFFFFCVCVFVFWRGAGEWRRGGEDHYSYNDYLRVKHFNEETLHIYALKKKNVLYQLYSPICHI